MIKVYVYVTGLVLYQFSATPGEPARALLAAGGYMFPGLGHIHAHEVLIQPGIEENQYTPQDDPSIVSFSADCASSPCPPIPPPPEVPNLADLVHQPSVRAECAAASKLDKCLAPHSSSRAIKGLIEFSGAWTTKAYTDCGDQIPTELDDFARINFIRLGGATKIMRTTVDDLDAHGKLANSVLFTTAIKERGDLTVLNGELNNKVRVYSSAECQGLPDFSASGASECLVVVIRNGSSDPGLGGGDVHYGAIYSLLQGGQHLVDPWLPITGRGWACSHIKGGGTAGGSNCVGGFVSN